MKPITLGEVARACGGTLHGARDDAVITAVTTDSRQVRDGALFAAIVGERVDGHRFIDDCITAGATAALCEKAPQSDVPYILVDSTREALMDVAAYYRSLFDIPFIGITGSVGKTTTKEFIAAVLSTTYCVHKTAGNFNNELGVPLTLFSLEEHHEVAVIEMGISDFGEMTRLSRMVRPDLSVITNIGRCHLENLVDRDGVLRAKTEMFTYLSDTGCIILCGDDDKLATVRAYRGIRPIFYGTDPSMPYYADNIRENALDGVSCTLHHGDTAIDVMIPAIGRHMVLGALCAMAVGDTLGVQPQAIRSGIEGFRNVGSRSRVVHTDRLTVIDDCYNANPTSTMAGIDTLSSLSGRRVAVLGDMKELGTDERALHRTVGAYAKERGIDRLIAVGELSEETAAGFGSGAFYYPTVDDCLHAIDTLLCNGDTVLIKASHSMHFEQIVAAIT